MSSNMRIALVHDYLKEYGGAERVLEVLHEMWPNAPIYTAFTMPEKWGPHRERLEKWDIRTTWMQKLPFKDQLTSHYSILGPMAFESLDLREYDVIINSTNPYISKSIITHPGQLHIGYVHTPPKAPWGFEGVSSARKNIFWKPFVKLADHYLRMADYSAAQRVDVLIANSETVAERVRKFYRRECVVVYPPVEVKNQKSKVKSKDSATHLNNQRVDGLAKNQELKTKNYFLMVGRLVGRKDLEVPVLAALKGGFNLKVVGKGMGIGSAEQNLRQLAQEVPEIEFLGEVSDEELRELYRGAKAVIDPRPDEDFGIIPVEAMAAGTPVIARDSGGFRETVIDGKTGVLFGGNVARGDMERLVESLLGAVKRFESLKISSEACWKQAKKFSRERFEKQMRELVGKEWSKINK